MSALALCSAVGGVAVSDCAGRDMKGLYSVLVIGSGSRSGADASAEMVRLWTSRRLWAVDEVPLLDVEPLACLVWRLDARRRANGTRTRMEATMASKPPTQPTMMIAMLLLWGDCEVVALG